MKRIVPAFFLLLVGCHKDKEETGDSALPPICQSGTAWSTGQLAFREVTADWGPDILLATGTRVIAVDFDGDGWTDLAVRSPTEGTDDFSSAKGLRYHWLLRNTGKGTFEDVTQQSGVVLPRIGQDSAQGRPGQVWAFGDVDNDGDLDLYTGLTDIDQVIDETSELMLNNGDGTFALGPENSEIRRDGETSPAAASFVDTDRDGFLDLWVPEYYYAQDRLNRGDGTGAFTDITDDSTLDTRDWNYVDDLNMALGHSVAWSGLVCDLNNDGSQELLAASYGRAPNHLWQAVGDGTFINRSIASGYAFDERTDWSDNESARCWCFLHPDDVDCKGVPAPEYITCNSDDDAFRWDHQYDREPFRLGGNSGTTVCGDVNNDGWMDLLTTEIVHWDVGSSSDPSELLINQGEDDVTFDRPGNDATGLTREHDSHYFDDGDMTGAIFDFDNDGWLDPLVNSSDYEGTRALLYHNDMDGTVSAVPIEDGLDNTRAHGVGIADFDRDGDLDVVLGHSSARCKDDCYDTFNVRFFENVTGGDQDLAGNFLQLHLEGAEGTNRAAIGARVQVTTPDGVIQTQEVGGGHGHYGIQHDLVLHFGLGASCAAEVSVQWPDQALSTETFSLGGGYRYHLLQGADAEVD